MPHNNHLRRSPNRRRHYPLIQIVSNIAQLLHMAHHKFFFCHEHYYIEMVYYIILYYGPGRAASVLVCRVPYVAA